MSRKKREHTAQQSAPAAVLDFDEDLQDVEDQEAADRTSGAPAAPPNGRKLDPKLIPRGPRLAPEEMWAFQAAYPNRDQIVNYVYRLEPAINLKLIGEKNTNIDEVPHPVTYEWLRNKFGSGRYQIRFHDASKQGPSKQVCDTIVSVNEYTTHPPQIDLRTIVDCRENASYIRDLINKNQLRRNMDGTMIVIADEKEKAGSKDGAGAADIVRESLQFAERAMQRQGKGNEGIEEFATKRIIEGVFDAQQKILEQATAGGGKDGGSMTAMLALVTQSMSMQNALMLKLLEKSLTPAPAAAPVSPFAGLQELATSIGAIAKIGRVFGGPGEGAAGEGEPWYARMAEKLAPGLMNLAILSQQNQARAAAGGSAAAPAGVPAGHQPAGGSVIEATAVSAQAPVTGDAVPASPEPGAADAAPGPMHATPGATADMSTAGSGSTAHAPNTTGQESAADQISIRGRLFPRKYVAQFGGQVFRCLERGIPGDHFAISLITTYDLSFYALVASLGKEGIIEALQSEPEIWAVLNMMPTDDLHDFIEEFIDYGREQGQSSSAGAAAPQLN